jgi:tellurite resistance protein TehA-like permease
MLYLVPYLLGSQVTTVGTSISNQLASVLVSSQNQTIALALCYLSAFLVGVMGLVAVAYNLRLASPAPSKADAGAAGQPAAQS